MSGLTRSMEATSAAEAAAVARRRRALPNGWWGVALFVASEATLFGCIIASYYYLRFKAAHWPPPGIEKPKVVLPLVFAGILIASAAPMAAAVRAAFAGRRGLAWLFLAAATLTQATYLGLQIWQYSDDLSHFSPKESAYGSVYFTLLGVHHLHVTAGIVLNLWLLYKVATAMTNYRFVGLRLGALYWYFVAVLEVPVVITQIYPSL